MSDQTRKYYCLIHEGFVEGALNVISIRLRSINRHAYICGECCKVHKTDGKPTPIPQMETQLEERLRAMPWLEFYTERLVTIAEYAAIRKREINFLRYELKEQLMK